MKLQTEFAKYRKITLAVSGKFHALSLAKEYEKLNLLEGIYCTIRDFKSPKEISREKFHNRIDLAWYQTIGSRTAMSGFSYKKKDNIFDRWMAKKITNIMPGVLHGWNGHSLETFKVAQRLGWKTCVERSCPHNQFQYDLLCDEAEDIGVNHYQDKEELKKAIEELYIADTIICPSKYSANSYIDPELIKKVQCVPLGSNFRYRDRKIKSNKGLRILMVGNNFLRKGTHYLIEAMKYIEDTEAELWIRGEIPSEYRTRINDPRIKIIGALPLTGLFELYESADVFVQPSVDEGFGMTVLEALSFGLPLVVTENVGARDILSKKVAKTVPIRDPYALAMAIIDAVSLPGNEFDIERKAIIEKNTWSLCAEKLLQIAY